MRTFLIEDDDEAEENNADQGPRPSYRYVNPSAVATAAEGTYLRAKNAGGRGGGFVEEFWRRKT
jgi:hypothetical protein